MLHSIQNTSPTYDEHEYIARGYTYLKTGDTNLKLRHPILLDTVAAVPLLFLPGIHLPLDHPSLAAGDFHLYARVFMWEVNEPIADQIVFLARLPNMLLTLLLVTAVSLWAKLLFGRKAGLFAMLIALLDPNILAHGRLVTPDVGQTTFIFLSVFTWWLFLQKKSWPRLLFAGAMLGLAQTAGFPALIVYPVIGLVTLVQGWRNNRLQNWLRLFGEMLGVGIISLLVIWIVYGFTWGPVVPESISVPAPYHWQEMLSLFQRLDRQDLAYLNGEVYRGGKFLFFIVAWLIKTPIPIQLFLIGGIAYFVSQRAMLHHLALWIVPLVYYGNALTTDLNIGYRHIMPILPFVYVIAGAALLWGSQNWQRMVRTGGILWLLGGTLAIFPHFLTYFNELVGGPANGKQYLVVSDLDWGQDMPGLKQYVDEHGINDLFVSWFGTASLDHYGIPYRTLPSWPPRGIPGQYAYHPEYPLPGVYAISAANLQGARFEDQPDMFAWFWQQQPEAVIGNSVYVYRVPRLLDEDAEPVNVLLTGATLDDIPGAVVAEYLQTNDMRPRWFNSDKAMVFPEGRTVWVRNTAVSLTPSLQQITNKLSLPRSFKSTNSNSLEIYESDMDSLLRSYIDTLSRPVVFIEPQQALNAIDIPLPVGDFFEFVGYQKSANVPQSGQSWEFITFWRVNKPTDKPLSIFVHVLADDGTIVAQHDGLDVNTKSLQMGDLIAQVHTVDMPDIMPETINWVAIGLYQTDTQSRFQFSIPGNDASGIERLFIPLNEAK